MKTDFTYWNPELPAGPTPASQARDLAEFHRRRSTHGWSQLMGRHYLDLPDARTLPTPGLVATHRAVTDLLSAAAVGVVHGMAGTGKTYAVEAALERLAHPGAEHSAVGVVTCVLAIALLAGVIAKTATPEGLEAANER